MPDVVIYPSGDGITVLFPAAGLSASDVAARDVPDGVPHRIVDAAALPTAATYRDAWTANFDDEPCAVTIDASKAEAVDTSIASAEIDVWFEAAIAEGYTTTGGWTLGLENDDVSLLTGNYVLSQAAASAGLDLPPIIDRNGVPHEIATIAELTALMLAYGNYRASLSAEHAARKAALEE